MAVVQLITVNYEKRDFTHMRLGYSTELLWIFYFTLVCLFYRRWSVGRCYLIAEEK